MESITSQLPMDYRTAFECVQRQAYEFEQAVIYDSSEVDTAVILGLAAEIVAHKEFVGLPVSINGGHTLTLEPVRAEDGHLTEQRQLIKNDLEVEGTYMGINIMPIDDPNFGDVYRMFHVVQTSKSISHDAVGNLEEKSYRTYVTAYDSQVLVGGFIGSHCYEDISQDGICQRIDELALDIEMPDHEKLRIIANMLQRNSEHYEGKEFIDRERISYLNHLGMFAGKLLAVKYLLYELEGELDEDGDVMHGLSYGPDNTYYIMEIQSFEHVDGIILDGDNSKLDDSKIILGIRGQHETAGEVIVPYHSDTHFVNSN